MKARAWLPRLGLFLALAAAVAWAWLDRSTFDADNLQRQLRDLGPWAPLLFVAMYAVATVLFLPGSILTVAGGALFGPVWGTCYSLAGATLGAVLAFLVARYLASDWIARKAGGRVKELVQGVEAEGWRFVAFVRLVPLFPFNLLNYALGLTRIRLRDYTVASSVCMLPGAIAFAYLGYAGREAAAGSEGSIRKGLVALGLLALIVFLPRLVRRLRAPPSLAVDELKRKLDAGEDLLVLDVRRTPDLAGELGHIAGARNIPLDDLPKRVQELEPWRKRPIAIVCRTERMSGAAVKLLAASGFAKVRVTRGGMTEWNRRGFPVAR